LAKDSITKVLAMRQTVQLHAYNYTFSGFSGTIAFACRALENGFVSVNIFFVRITKYFDNLQKYEIQLSLTNRATHLYNIQWRG